jgi:uncharacterized protein YndB with AHSA1/START domain
MATASRNRSTFRLSYAVSERIAAPPARVWSLLTNAADFPRWNSTVTSIDGAITAGETIRLQAKAAPGRTFKLKVSDVVPDTSMVWSDGFAPMFRGVRTFTLSAASGGGTDFSMEEVFSGLMLPMIAGSLPDFVPVFEAYAADLKREAEKG